MNSADLPDKAEIRELLWESTRLGAELDSVDDDRLDDADLALDSLTLITVVTQLERSLGRPVPVRGAGAAFRTVNGIHRHLATDSPPRSRDGVG